MGQQSSHVDSDASGSKQIVDVGGTRFGAGNSQAENGLSADSQPQRSRVDKIFRRASSTLNTRIKGRDRSSSPGNARSSKAAKQALRGSPRDSEPESSLSSERRKDNEAARSAGAKDSGSVEELDRGSIFKDNSALEKSFLQTGELDLDEIILLDARRSAPLASISSRTTDFSDSDSAAMGNLNTAKCFAPSSRLAASSEVFNGHGQVKGRGSQNQKSVAPGATGNVLLSQEPRPPELGSYLTVAPVVSPGDMGLSPIDEITETPINYASGPNVAARNGATEVGSALQNAHRKEEMHVTKTENLSKNLSQGDVRPSGVLLSTGNTVSLSLNLQKTDLSHDGILGSADSSGSAVVSPDIFADAASVVTDKSPFESPYTSAAENSAVELDDSPEMVDESQRTSSQTLTPSDVDDDGSLLPRVKSVSLDKIDNSECPSDCYPRAHRGPEARNSATTSSLPQRKHSHAESNSKGRKVGHGSENVSTMQEGQRSLPIGDGDRKNAGDAHSKYSVSLETGIESTQHRERRPHQATGSRRRSEISSEDFQQETDTSTENIPKRVSRSSSAASQSKHRNRYSSESSQQMSDSEEMQRSTTFKSSSRTFSQLSLDEVVAVPKTVPEKLDFQQLEKFEGKQKISVNFFNIE